MVRPCRGAALRAANQSLAELEQVVRRGRPKTPERYFVDEDGSGHRYIVPLSRKAEWDKWSHLPEDDEDGWEAPEWAQRLEGELLTFTDPRTEK